jgi:hypothetical protein
MGKLLLYRKENTMFKNRIIITLIGQLLSGLTLEDLKKVVDVMLDAIEIRKADSPKYLLICKTIRDLFQIEDND